MFTKLRNKFLILNMAITSTVMIAAFAIIYFITYSNIHSEIEEKLKLPSQMQITIAGAIEAGTIEESPLTESITKNTGKRVTTAPGLSLDNTLSFNIEVDAEGRILNINSFIDLSEEAYDKAVEAAWNNKSSNSTITLEDRQWRYNVVPISLQVIQGNRQQIISDGNRFNIVFLDVTAYNKTLLELLTTLVVVGLITLMVIFVVSLYFANRAIKPIAGAWEKQKQFVADASHELKTPISIINANYDALLANQEDTIKNQMKWLDYIRIGTDRMAKLTNDLLSLAKLEDVNIETQKTPFDISSAIDEVISPMEAVILEKDIKLSRSIEPDIIIKSDAEKIRQVVRILLDNAVKYTNEKGHIHISLARSKRQVTFSIKNSGKGIPQQDLPKVFDRFYRADPSRTHEGSYGLGLSIAKTIIHRLGGEIEVTSVENEYTTFTFTLGL